MMGVILDCLAGDQRPYLSLQCMEQPHLEGLLTHMMLLI